MWWMLIIWILAIIGQFLAYNPTLEDVAKLRQKHGYNISPDVKIDEYECLLGLPYGFGEYIGQALYFREEAGKLHGPWLVVDVEAKKHAGTMDKHNLLADINCSEHVHKKGELILIVR
jgi:hypothetical protein